MSQFIRFRRRAEPRRRAENPNTASLLDSFELPAEPAAAEELCAAIAAGPAELDFLCDYYKDVLLFFPAASPQGHPVSPVQAQSPRSPPAAGGGAAAAAPPAAVARAQAGLSLSRIGRLTKGKQPPSMSELTGWKTGILKLVAALGSHKGATAVFSESQSLSLLLAGSCDFDDAVSRQADDAVRRLKFDIESSAVVTALFSLLLGTPRHMQSVPLADRIAPASVALRAKIFVYLNKSDLAANCFPSSLEAIVGSAFGAQPGEAGDALLRVKVLGMEFTRWVVKRAADPKFTPMAPVLYNSLLKAIGGTTAGGVKTATLRGLTFNAIAEVALRQPALVNKETTLVRLLFEVLGSKDEVRCSTI